MSDFAKNAAFEEPVLGVVTEERSKALPDGDRASVQSGFHGKRTLAGHLFCKREQTFHARV
jgi:hypothetical protein